MALGVKTPGGCADWSAEQVRRVELAAAFTCETQGPADA